MQRFYYKVARSSGDRFDRMIRRLEAANSDARQQIDRGQRRMLGKLSGRSARHGALS